MARVSIERRDGERRTTYRVRYSVNGSRAKRTEGTYSRKIDAVKAANRLRVQLETGEHDQDASRGKAMTFAGWVDEWAERSQHRRSSTAARDALVLRVHWIPQFGELTLPEVTPFEVTGAVAALQRTHAEATVRTNVEVLSRCLGAAVEHGLLRANPCKAVKLRRAPQRTEDIRFLSRDELRALVAEVRPDFRAAIVLAALLGLRWGEVVGLRTGRIDFERRRLHVVETTSETVLHELIFRTEVKSTAGVRTLPLPADIAELLRAHVERYDRTDPDALVIVREDGSTPLRAYFRANVLGPAARRAGIDGLTFHGLRHSAAGYLIEAGVHPELMRKWMGHSDVRTTLKLYGRVSDETFERAAEALSGVLDAQPPSANSAEGGC